MARIYEVDAETKLQSTITHCRKLARSVDTDKLSIITYTDLLNYAATLQDLLEAALEEQEEYEWQLTSGLRPDF